MIKLFIIGSLFSFCDSTNIAKQTDISNVNSYHSQYFPQFIESTQEIFFTIRKNKGDHEDIYVSKVWQGAALPPSTIGTLNTPLFNEGTCTFSEDGQTIIFSACDYPNSKGGCDLYESNRINNQWSIPKNLGFFINSREWDGQPHLTNHGKTIYFSSERAGGLGSRDLWVSEKDQHGVWGIPKNLGPNINSSANEMGPYRIKNKQILLFSSDRKGGKGKLDFYQSLNEENEWSNPSNLDLLNTKEDNAGICLGSRPNEFFVTESNTNKNPSEKIYSIILPDSIWLKNKPKAQIKEISTAKQLFSDISFTDIYFANNKWDLPSIIPNSLIKLFQYLSENSTVKIIIEGHSDETGKAKSNIILSEKRALSVKKYLIQQGISADRMQIKGFGHLKPKSKELAGNRRIEVKQL